MDTQALIESLATPHKLGRLVLAPSLRLGQFDSHARDSAALSRDLFHWEKIGRVLVDVGSEGSVDSRYAHKAGLIARDGRLHHFYCAVAPAVDPRQGEIEYGEVRGISLTRG